jgi:hypothetical protein
MKSKQNFNFTYNDSFYSWFLQLKYHSRDVKNVQKTTLHSWHQATQRLENGFAEWHDFTSMSGKESMCYFQTSKLNQVCVRFNQVILKLQLTRGKAAPMLKHNAMKTYGILDFRTS